MKAMLLTAAVLALAGAAGASALNPFMTDRRAPPIQISAPADRGACALRADPYSVQAFAAPMNAVRWSLDVRSQGFSAEQSGPLFGDAAIMSRVSRITLVRDNGRGVSGSRGGPVQAELTLYDADDRIVCADRLIRGPSRW